MADGFEVRRPKQEQGSLILAFKWTGVRHSSMGCTGRHSRPTRLIASIRQEKNCASKGGEFMKVLRAQRAISCCCNSCTTITVRERTPSTKAQTTSATPSMESFQQVSLRRRLGCPTGRCRLEARLHTPSVCPLSQRAKGRRVQRRASETYE